MGKPRFRKLEFTAGKRRSRRDSSMLLMLVTGDCFVAASASWRSRQLGATTLWVFVWLPWWTGLHARRSPRV